MIREGRIEIAIPENCSAEKFDGENHGLSHCMKAVDFIIETPRVLHFLEIKDPDASTDAQRRTEYIEQLTSGRIDYDLKYKFRDTWIYMNALNRINKPVNYLVLLAVNSLSSETLSARRSALIKQLPLEGANGPWPNPFVANCAVFNLDTWNASLPEFTARLAA